MVDIICCMPPVSSGIATVMVPALGPNCPGNYIQVDCLTTLPPSQMTNNPLGALGGTIAGLQGTPVDQQAPKKDCGCPTGAGVAIPQSVCCWVSDVSNWKDLGLIIGGALLILVGLIAFATEQEKAPAARMASKAIG
jgi:hypothetical protein